MLPEQYQWIAARFEPGDGDPWLLFEIAKQLEADGNPEGAATALDRAFGLDPGAEEVRRARQRVLERLTVVEHGLRFRYVPAGTFLMGRNDGEADEGPWHPVYLSAFWMSETPVSWATYCRLMGWQPPPEGVPPDYDWEGARDPNNPLFEVVYGLFMENRIRMQYCEDRTTRATDWHAHDPSVTVQVGGQWRAGHEVFGTPPREDPEAAWEYAAKPMVAVSWQQAQELGKRLSSPAVRYGLPTEAQWEKAARGGLIGARHAWGDDPTAPDRCDFDRFREFSVLPMTSLPPNGYGLYAVNGGVWEWTSDWYDRDYYREAPAADPQGPAKGKEKVLRGGSWSDCGEAVTVTFRMSRPAGGPKSGAWGGHLAPNFGFRLCRTAGGPA